MAEYPRVLLFRGRPVVQLTREEAIHACHRLMDELENERRWQRLCRETSEAFDTARQP